MSKFKAFQPNTSTPVLNPDGTLSPPFVSFLNQLLAQTNFGGDELDELRGAIYAFLAPGLSGLGAQIFEQGKEVQDLVQSIAANQSQGQLTAATLFECKKIITDHRELIASLLATAGSLSAQLSEATKPRPIRFPTSALQLLDNDLGASANASGGNFGVTVPDPEKNTGKTYFLSNTGGSGTVTWLPFGSEKLGGSSSLSVPSTTPHTTIELTSDGTDYLTS